MNFSRISPPGELKRFIECYWIAEDGDPTVRREKIIPDGFTEIILHFGDPYRICIDGTWQLQSNNLLGGQISRHFFLENTGRSSILGIKFKPVALAQLYDLSMSDFTNKVEKANEILDADFCAIVNGVREESRFDRRIDLLNEYFIRQSVSRSVAKSPVERAMDLLLERHGMLSLEEMQEMVGVGERRLEALFKKQIGLSPKLFARILRFSYIFQRVEDLGERWSDLAYEAAFYDQSHFIRNFKDFTGESPGKYGFDKKNLANFFLKKG